MEEVGGVSTVRIIAEMRTTMPVRIAYGPRGTWHESEEGKATGRISERRQEARFRDAMFATTRAGRLQVRRVLKEVRRFTRLEHDQGLTRGWCFGVGWFRYMSGLEWAWFSRETREWKS